MTTDVSEAVGPSHIPSFPRINSFFASHSARACPVIQSPGFCTIGNLFLFQDDVSTSRERHQNRVEGTVVMENSGGDGRCT